MLYSKSLLDTATRRSSSIQRNIDSGSNEIDLLHEAHRTMILEIVYRIEVTSRRVWLRTGTAEGVETIGSQIEVL